MIYADTLRSLYSRTADGIKLGLETTRALLKALGDPQDSLRHVVLVAGTNGKGSTSALIARALETDWPNVGFFSSPHLLRFADRIRIGRRTVTDEAVVAMYDEIRSVEHLCPQPPTFFECVTAMAALTYARGHVSTAVFEVGLGGRLDATNVLRRDIAVITPIGLDHMSFLGDSVELIAAEKAAIIAEGGIAVNATQSLGAQRVIERHARERQARLVQAPLARQTGDMLVLAGQGLERAVRLAPWVLPGYQKINVATAAAVCQELQRLGVLETADAFERAVREFDWPGRYQWVDLDPPLLLDGAHNPHAIAALLAAMADDARLRDRPVHGVFTALRDKNADEMLAMLKPRLASLHLVPVGSRRTRTEAELQALAPDARVYATVEAALDGARRAAGADASDAGSVVLVTGSLFLVGAVLAIATGAPHDPPVDG
jgi:dihydrofolate synthase / folylpolyglutamate synthase